MCKTAQTLFDLLSQLPAKANCAPSHLLMLAVLLLCGVEPLRPLLWAIMLLLSRLLL